MVLLLFHFGFFEWKLQMHEIFIHEIETWNTYYNNTNENNKKKSINKNERNARIHVNDQIKSIHWLIDWLIALIVYGKTDLQIEISYRTN